MQGGCPGERRRGKLQPTEAPWWAQGSAAHPLQALRLLAGFHEPARGLRRLGGVRACMTHTAHAPTPRRAHGHLHASHPSPGVTSKLYVLLSKLTFMTAGVYEPAEGVSTSFQLGRRLVQKSQKCSRLPRGDGGAAGVGM